MTDPVAGALGNLDAALGEVFGDIKTSVGAPMDPELSRYLKMDQVDFYNLISELGLPKVADYVKEMEMRRVENANP